MSKMTSGSNKSYEANEAVKRSRERWERCPGFQGMLEQVQRLWAGVCELAPGASMGESELMGSAVGKGGRKLGRAPRS